MTNRRARIAAFLGGAYFAFCVHWLAARQWVYVAVCASLCLFFTIGGFVDPEVRS